jgi:Uma2 family endonuclease
VEIPVVEPKPALLSPAEYLEREEKNPVKCEYVDGEVYAMSGAKRRHNLIASNLVIRRGGMTRTRGCLAA